MKGRTYTRFVAVTVVLGAVTSTAATSAHAAGQPVNGCPNGYQLLAVADLAPQGYRVPGRLDDPNGDLTSFGQHGNGDGYVCAQEVGDRTTPWGGQLYQFWDNSLPV